MNRRQYLVTCALASLAGCFRKPRRPDTPVPIKEVGNLRSRIGVSHIDGKYALTNEDYLNEGGKQIRALGTDVVKTSFQRPADQYPFNSSWPDEPSRLVEIASHHHYREFFELGFTTHVITAYSLVRGQSDSYFREGVSDTQYEQEVQEFEELTRYLLEEYDGTGKTFVLQNWEGDWHLLGGTDTRKDPSSTAIRGMIRWLNARQEGVERAREDVESSATVLHACEVNLVRQAMVGDRPRMITEVVPETDCDLVSYSAWDVLGEIAGWGRLPRWSGGTDFRDGPDLIRNTLDYIRRRVPSPSEYVDAILAPDQLNVYIGEYGWPLNEGGRIEALRVIGMLTETAVRWGAPLVLFWQLYDNELRHDVDGQPKNGDVKGYYLIRPDGTKALTWPYFESLFAAS